ncbi:hypothetical protein ACQKOF_22295 [Lysinibacillus sp. NPDC093190]|uniref:hypothetical protein n=1 Tax=Lysinibacillus sp. NPDC093190 TaxID=3390575 RepID=UPI003D04C61D
MEKLNANKNNKTLKGKEASLTSARENGSNLCEGQGNLKYSIKVPFILEMLFNGSI